MFSRPRGGTPWTYLRKCERCRLKHHSKHPIECPHCTGLSDGQLLVLIERRKAGEKKRASIGRMMLLGAGVIVLLTMFAQHI